MKTRRVAEVVDYDCLPEDSKMQIEHYCSALDRLHETLAAENLNPDDYRLVVTLEAKLVEG
jgi:hypothetical protein